MTDQGFSLNFASRMGKVMNCFLKALFAPELGSRRNEIASCSDHGPVLTQEEHSLAYFFKKAKDFFPLKKNTDIRDISLGE